MRRNTIVLSLLLCAGFVLSGCGAPELPEVTFFADGHTTSVSPFRHCDVHVQECDLNPGGIASLKVRPDMPVQVSVPKEITDTPWLVKTQSVNAAGEWQPVREQFFRRGTQYAYTAMPDGPGHRVAVVEIQQIGAATPAGPDDKPLVDEAGNPLLLIRAHWSLETHPG